MPAIRFISLLLILLSLSACSAWTRVDDKNRHYQSSYFSFYAPSGWMLLDTGSSVVLSRDGPDLQRIGVVFHTSDKAFPTINKPASTDMLPSELAELAIAEIRASQENGMPGLKVVRNEPVTIDGHQGFSLHLRFILNSGLRYETKVHGFVTPHGLYAIYFRAPSLHFFDRDQDTYTQIVESFHVKKQFRDSELPQRAAAETQSPEVL